MTFSKRLDKVIIKTLLEQEGLMDVDSPAEQARRKKMIDDMNRTADQISNNMIIMVEMLKNSGYGDNRTIDMIIKQFETLSDGLKLGGNVRKNLESILNLPAPQ